MRYVTEKVLHRLCSSHGVTWGKGEPTLERMIGPLLAQGVIPKNIGIHVRTIQTNASPGSHYQESSLSSAHVQVAQIALLDFLEWFYVQQEHGELPALPQQTAPSPATPAVRRTRAGAIALTLGILLVVAVFASVALRTRTPTGPRAGVVLGVELDGEDVPLARWVLEQQLAGIAEAVVADGGDRAPDEWLLDGQVDEDGELSWAGARGRDGALRDPVRDAALSAARRQVVDLPPIPWNGGLTLRIGTAPKGGDSWADVTGAVPLDGAPLAAVGTWGDAARRELAEALLREVPEAYFHGEYRLRAEFALRATETGTWESAETISIRPEAYSTRAGNWLGIQGDDLTEPLDPATLPAPPSSVAGRHARIAVLAIGTRQVPPAILPDRPTAFENLVVSPPRLSIDPSDVVLLYSKASPFNTLEFTRQLDGALDRFEACDDGLFSGSGLLRATTVARISIDPEQLYIHLHWSEPVGDDVGGSEGEGEEQQRGLAAGAVLDCIQAEIQRTPFPAVQRLAIAELTLTVGPPLPHVTPGQKMTEEQAAQVVLARFLPRHLEQIACTEALAPTPDDSSADSITPWYAEVDAQGELVKFVPHFRTPPSPERRACSLQLVEGLRLPATGHDVVLDPFGVGPDEGPDNADDRQGLADGGDAATGEPDVTEEGSDGLGALKQFVSTKKPEIKACYEDALRRNPDLAGKVEVMFTVHPNGRVSELSLTGNTGDPWMEDCIASKIVAWYFPSGEEEIEVYYPFNLFASPSG